MPNQAVNPVISVANVPEQVNFRVYARIEDWELLKSESFLLDDTSSSKEECLYALMVNPEKAPVDAGYELLAGTKVSHWDGDLYVLSVNAMVHDKALLKAAAEEAYHTCWGAFLEDCYDDDSSKHLLYEALVASNSSIAPSDAGYAITRYDAE
jgi:hypothetical protein